MIQFENVFKSFGSNRVLRGCTFDVQDGETLTIIGGSGTGKSVTLKLMLGLLKPDSGHIIVDGQDITDMKEDALSKVQNHFSYVFQGGALFDSMTVGENVAFGLQQLGQHPPEEIDGDRQRKIGGGRTAGHRIAQALGTLRRHAQARGHCALHRHEPQIFIL